jgi:hypothetical protein
MGCLPPFMPNSRFLCAAQDQSAAPRALATLRCHAGPPRSANNLYVGHCTHDPTCHPSPPQRPGPSRPPPRGKCGTVRRACRVVGDKTLWVLCKPPLLAPYCSAPHCPQKADAAIGVKIRHRSAIRAIAIGATSTTSYLGASPCFRDRTVAPLWGKGGRWPRNSPSLRKVRLSAARRDQSWALPEPK